MPHPPRLARIASPKTGHLLTLAVLVVAAAPASALLVIDFEQPYYVHPGTQVWDHCLVELDDRYHMFYHGIPESDPDPSYSDHIWHTSTADLIHWSPPEVVLSVSEAPHESRAVWAPDVVYDPVSELWWMSYTGVDSLRNQRICMASSPDLEIWTKLASNPVVEPDPDIFHWYPEFGWGECRDPQLLWLDDTWQMVISAKALDGPEGRGALGIATSPDLIQWSSPQILMLNDGDGPTNALESPQYVVRDVFHHIFFHEYTTSGISHIVSLAPEGWHLDNGNLIDLGIAPEVETFDGGETFIFTRIAPYQEPEQTALSYVARLDTLVFGEGVEPPVVSRPHPLLRHFAAFGGNACLGNPCFGDNPARRGEEPVNLEGYWFFGSREYFQGPLSGRGDAGRLIGDAAQGWAETAPFVVEGASISLLVGGTNNPEHCFVALVDAATDSVLHSATGSGTETMSRRYWNIQDLQGTEVYLRIEDSDGAGHINVDDIIESYDVVTAVDEAPAAAPSLLVDRGPRPNPFNPATELRFDLAAPAACRVRIHDLRGRLVWDSGSFAGRQGANALTWRGIDTAGIPAAAGVYVYRIAAAGRVAASGKLTLLP